MFFSPLTSLFSTHALNTFQRAIQILNQIMVEIKLCHRHHRNHRRRQCCLPILCTNLSMYAHCCCCSHIVNVALLSLVMLHHP